MPIAENFTMSILMFDGAASNMAMVNILGCHLDCLAQNCTTSFPYPVTLAPVVVFLDPCHMLKLVRNTLADKKSMFDENNKFVKFEFIEKLHKLQQTEGLDLCNKLRAARIAW